MEITKWLTYWKNSLQDSLKSDIEIKNLRHFEIDNFKMDAQSINDTLAVNNLFDYEEERINRKKGVSDKKSINWVKLEIIQVLIAPLKILPLPERLVFLRDHTPKFPFWYFANLNRLGELSVPEESFPVFQRRFLEPLADERTEYIFSTVDKVDLASTIGKEEYKNYGDYVENLNSVFKFTVDQDLGSYNTDGYKCIYNATVLVPNEDINAAIGIIELYEKILKEKNLPTMLSEFISLKNANYIKTPLTVGEFIDANNLHLGQMGFDFPLSISQRKSLLTLLKNQDKVFAINGPPGTGKTTLIQSIVANKMVERAIEGGQPPIILACSTNNQAVTNIIDSFSKSNTLSGALQGRWLPEVEGYATFLPASGKTEAELKGINYKKLSGEGLFNRLENYEYLEQAENYFLQKCSAYFNLPNISIADGVKKLQQEIISNQSKLYDASKKWKDYLKGEELFKNTLCIGISETDSYYSNSLLNEQVLEKDIEKLESTEQGVINYFENEPILRKLFCFFGFDYAIDNRTSHLKIILRDSLIAEITNLKINRNFILKCIDRKINTIKDIIMAIREWKLWKQKNGIKGNPPKTEDEYWDKENLKINGVKNKERDNSLPNCFYDELDVSLRHIAFQLAVHYWEGRWLIDLKSNISDCKFKGKGEKESKERCQRHAMLTPCFVSTFYMAPKFFSSYKFLKKGKNEISIFDKPPLYDFIDLLIVDEAGQVSPEVGVANFSLAKQAVVFGDIKQIEPVWNVSNKIDIGNLKKGELIRDYDDLRYEEEFDPKGFLASTGSIMKMAQNACSYKEEDQDEKGIMLLEHRRCYDEIIKYCNVLAYNGKLKPLKGGAENNTLFPPMFCVHVEGNSSATNSSSRYNQNEVSEIVKWLILNKQKIESKYGKLENAVGIITPFVGQKNNLRYALKNAGFDVEIMKYGTVHALQGAERPIILFSMVYGKGDSETMFFDKDNKPNMLNVAVSRAKESFIVFANTAILDKKAKTPSGILANHLKYESQNL